MIYVGQLKVLCEPNGLAKQVYFDCRELLVDLVAITTTTWNQTLVDQLTQQGYTVTVTEPDLTVSQRIALWCQLWKQYKGTAYRVMPSDAGKMRHLKLDAAMLHYYLNDDALPAVGAPWYWRGKQSISNLVKYQNEVRASMSAPAPSRHPNHWSQEHLRKLDGAGITEYHRHLKGLGLVARIARDGSILDYVANGTDKP
jgi:hypothetical protein